MILPMDLEQSLCQNYLWIKGIKIFNGVINIFDNMISCNFRKSDQFVLIFLMKWLLENFLIIFMVFGKVIFVEVRNPPCKGTSINCRFFTKTKMKRFLQGQSQELGDIGENVWPSSTFFWETYFWILELMGDEIKRSVFIRKNIF